MPYIDPKQRKHFDKLIGKLASHVSCAGDMNYVISSLVRRMYIDVRYDDINEVIGVLECAKFEFYRRVAAPYEDKKLHQNGDL